MRTLVFLLLCAAAVTLAGCSAEQMGPVTSAAPAAFIIVPQRLTLTVRANSPADRRSNRTAAGRLAPRRESMVAARGRRSVRRATASCFVDAVAIGAESAAITPLASRPAPASPAYELPPGKYPLTGEDKIGFYYRAPNGLIVDGSWEQGGIYWDKIQPAPRYIFVNYAEDPHTRIIFSDQISHEVVIPKVR